jgi:hypothetical protein
MRSRTGADPRGPERAGGACLRYPVEPRHLAVRANRQRGRQQLIQFRREAERPAPLPAFAFSSNSSPGMPGASFCRSGVILCRDRLRRPLSATLGQLGMSTSAGGHSQVPWVAL